MASIRTALIYSSFSQYILKLLSLISVIVVARLLSPKELGVYAIASSLILIAGELKSLGTGSYLIRQAKVDNETIKSATGLMLILSWTFGVFLLITAPVFARFYQIYDLKNLIYLLSYSFFLAPFISVPRALLTRSLRFKEIFYISVTTQVLLLTFTIIFILQGFSYFSLAYASIIGYTTEFILTVIFRPKNTPWLPGFKNMKEMLHFGVFVTASNLFSKFSLSLPDLIIGKQGTVTEVAIFSRGLGFLDFTANTLKQGVSPVALPYLSEKIRQGYDLEEPYLRSTMLLGVIVWPALAVAGVLSHPIILLFFGEKWLETAPIVSVLCIWAILRNIHPLASQLLIASGKEKTLCAKEGILFLLTFGSIWISYPLGLQCVGWGLAGVAAIDFIYVTTLLKVSLNFKLINFFVRATSNIAIALACSVVAYTLAYASRTQEINELTSLLFIIPTAVVVWFLGLKISHHDLWAELIRLRLK